MIGVPIFRIRTSLYSAFGKMAFQNNDVLLTFMTLPLSELRSYTLNTHILYPPFIAWSKDSEKTLLISGYVVFV